VPAIAAVALVGLVAATVAGVLWVRRGASAGEARVGAARQVVAPGAFATLTAVPSQTPTPTSTPTPAPAGSPTAGGMALAGGPPRFGTLAPGSALPSSAQCAAWVRALPFPENKRVNRPFNQVTGQALAGDFFPDARAAAQIGSRVDGAFTGTTREILRWAACKWGIDEDIAYAQAAKESWWRQTNQGDFGGDASACPPGHGLGADGQPGQCPQSYGILQDRFPYERSSWPGIARSTAMNADTAYATWRACFEGYEPWLNQVDRGRQYGAGDAWGCVGRMFAGRWHTAPADQYAAAVQAYQAQRIWEQPNFQEP
jgi:autotransporter family porin